MAYRDNPIAEDTAKRNHTVLVVAIIIVLIVLGVLAAIYGLPAPIAKLIHPS